MTDKICVVTMPEPPSISTQWVEAPKEPVWNEVILSPGDPGYEQAKEELLRRQAEQSKKG